MVIAFRGMQAWIKLRRTDHLRQIPVHLFCRSATRLAVRTAVAYPYWHLLLLVTGNRFWRDRQFHEDVAEMQSNFFWQ